MIPFGINITFILYHLLRQFNAAVFFRQLCLKVMFQWRSLLSQSRSCGIQTAFKGCRNCDERSFEF